MRSIFLTLFSVLSLSLFAQEINQLDANGERHGIWRKTYKDTKVLRYEGAFEHGKEKGVFKFYENIDGKAILMATRTFNPANNLAEVRFLTKEGKTVSEGKMKGKTYVGKWLYYHKNSKQLMTEEFYNDHSELEGERKTYYLSGQVAEIANYKNNEFHGVSKWFSEQGKLIRFFSYENGLLEGPAKAYDGNGNLMMEGVYRNDKKHGIWKYYENGKFVKKTDFTRRSKNPKYKKQ